MRGVILEGELYGRSGATGETVRVFLELEDGTVHARRAYGELAALKHEAARQPPAPTPEQP
jgi:hypothetical protein